MTNVRPNIDIAGARWKRFVGALLVVLFCLTARTLADTEAPRIVFGPWAGPVTFGPGMNLAGRNLRGTDIVGQNIPGAIFDDCDMYRVRLCQCDLTGASFRGARLTEASIDDCVTTGADFTDAEINGMTHFHGKLNLTAEQFMSTHSYKSKQLEKCEILGGYSTGVPRFDFRGAKLNGSQLQCNFSDTDFTDAQIFDVAFNCGLRFEQLASTQNFKGGGLSGVTLPGAIIGKQDYTGIHFRRCTIYCSDDAIFENAQFSDRCWFWQFNRRQLASTRNYKRGDLTNLIFARLDLSHFDLSGMNLTNTHFGIRCNLTDADFTDAVITRAVFSEDKLNKIGLTLEQIKSTWNYKQGRMEGIDLPERLAEALRREATESKPAATK